VTEVTQTYQCFT